MAGYCRNTITVKYETVLVLAVFSTHMHHIPRKLPFSNAVLVVLVVIIIITQQRIRLCHAAYIACSSNARGEPSAAEKVLPSTGDLKLTMWRSGSHSCVCGTTSRRRVT